VSLSKEELDSRITKKIKAFLARIAKVKRVSEINILEIGYTAAILKDSNIEISIPIPKSYRAAINNPIYRQKEHIAIKEKLKALGINST
jgi:hypothetical protein